ncbi:hypothetical protein [Prevotella intermedia]|uniref:hypothetical protein n=1 Tax=Prevotella intermedia TaxID=28131 RepID=UPI00397D1C02
MKCESILGDNVNKPTQLCDEPEKVVLIEFNSPALAFGNYCNTFIMKKSAYLAGD